MKKIQLTTKVILPTEEIRTTKIETNLKLNL